MQPVLNLLKQSVTKQRRTLLRLCAVLALGAAIVAHADDTYRIVHTYPHDALAFTQGLIYADGHLYESTGLKGQSSLRMVDLETGRPLQVEPVPIQYFAEGLTKWGSTLIQLTWQAHKAFVYDQFSFRELRTFAYTGEGWGLTEDGKHLILSDGTSTLRFLDPVTFREVRHIVVKDHDSQVDELNELEFVHGEIYANIWHSDRIARISPASGAVLGFINLAGLLPPSEHSTAEAVLNGIAWDSVHR